MNKNYKNVKFDETGKIICNICGKSYHVLSLHIKGTHKLTVEQYKEMFGLNRSTKLTSLQVRERKGNLENLNKHRVLFKKGHSINKGKPKRHETIENRKGMKYKKRIEK